MMMDFKSRILALERVRGGEHVNASDISRNIKGLSTVEIEVLLQELVDEGDMIVVPTTAGTGPTKTRLYRKWGAVGRLQHAPWVAFEAPRNWTPQWY